MKFKRLFLKKCEFVENVNLRKVQILSGIFHHRKKAKHIFTHHRALQKQAVSLAHITKRKINAFKSLLNCSLKTQPHA